jgi:hypothetical protein
MYTLKILKHASSYGIQSLQSEIENFIKKKEYSQIISLSVVFDDKKKEFVAYVLFN